jgi:hypothetical protein
MKTVAFTPLDDLPATRVSLLHCEASPKAALGIAEGVHIHMPTGESLLVVCCPHAHAQTSSCFEPTNASLEALRRARQRFARSPAKTWLDDSCGPRVLLQTRSCLVTEYLNLARQWCVARLKHGRLYSWGQGAHTPCANHSRLAAPQSGDEADR